MKLLVVSTPVGRLGSGRGGGVELTLINAVAGLLERGHSITVLAPEGSQLPTECSRADLCCESGVEQPSWQHQRRDAPVVIPAGALLGRLWRRALGQQDRFDGLLNLAYDWLPLWLTPHTTRPLGHLISMGSVGDAMDGLIAEIAGSHPDHLAFHTAAQASDFALKQAPTLVGNGFDPGSYQFNPDPERLLGWAGRVAPEKGLEDAAAVAARMGFPLAVWGLREDLEYARQVEAGVPPGTIQWRGFLPTAELQAALGRCAALLNTPKWNEAYGNVVVEAMACGVPVAAYARGGPGELVREGINGALAEPGDLAALEAATRRALTTSRAGCREWMERHGSRQAFSERLERWLNALIRAW
ncbi:MAG: glycosyltransferase [Cyanobacteriota bacterium]|nr:glycosyltransferase [Cyanobacteriota bacterium]